MRTTTDVINDVLRENARGTWLLYLLTMSFVVVGLGVIAYSVLSAGSVGEGVIGAIASALCYPALHMARSIRQENIMIRTLEIPLNNASTAEDAAKMLQVLMEKVFLKRSR